MNESPLIDKDVAHLCNVVAGAAPGAGEDYLRIVLTYDSMFAVTLANEVLGQIKRNPSRRRPLKLEIWNQAALNDADCRGRAAVAAASADLLLMATADARKNWGGFSAELIGGELAAQAGAPKTILAILAHPRSRPNREGGLGGLDSYASKRGSAFLVVQTTIPDPASPLMLRRSAPVEPFARESADSAPSRRAA